MFIAAAGSEGRGENLRPIVRTYWNVVVFQTIPQSPKIAKKAKVIRLQDGKTGKSRKK